MINKVIFFVFMMAIIASCNTKNTNSSSPVIQSIDAYLAKARSNTNPKKALKNAYKELSILSLNNPSLSAIHYDSCLTIDLANRVENIDKNNLQVNILNLNLLNNFMEGKQVDDAETNWDFLHSRDFDYLISLDKLNEASNNEAMEALARWYKIKDIRYTVVLKEQNKILPRTQYDNYVLGGYFQGYGIFYDLVEHKVLCYFNLRINNLSNKIEDYTKDDMNVYEAMMAELRTETKRKIQVELSRKLTIVETQVDPGL